MHVVVDHSNDPVANLLRMKWWDDHRLGYFKFVIKCLFSLSDFVQDLQRIKDLRTKSVVVVVCFRRRTSSGTDPRLYPARVSVVLFKWHIETLLLSLWYGVAVTLCLFLLLEELRGLHLTGGFSRSRVAIQNCIVLARDCPKKGKI